MLKKLFCKHDYKLIVCEQQPSIKELATSTQQIRVKIGCSVHCTKCGKKKRRLAKQILKLIATEKSEYYKRSFENEYQRFYHQG